MGYPSQADDGKSRSLERARPGPRDEPDVRRFGPILTCEEDGQHARMAETDSGAWVRLEDYLKLADTKPTPQENPDNGEASDRDEAPQPRGENLPDGQDRQ